MCAYREWIVVWKVKMRLGLGMGRLMQVGWGGVGRGDEVRAKIFFFRQHFRQCDFFWCQFL